jgi:hypothetical protein
MAVSCRYALAFMGCLGIMNVYFCRINLSVAMVAMVGLDRPNRVTNETCRSLAVNEKALRGAESTAGVFLWSKKQQGLVTASYYWSYAACQVQVAEILAWWNARQPGTRRLARRKVWLPPCLRPLDAGERPAAASFPRWPPSSLRPSRWPPGPP